ncbi:hypothetical protein SAMN05443287_11162 [Micromonospora phaseoli]|uniref:Uncharacterized protein n=1 Tax=Micromonospora phaseoli TaxID=1144548 RepID=A0A1H7D6Y5_9ACTN|nr:hypothetical protein [Micromonospora phaseoli]PZV98047.1 hypothetical protein CLV64_105315 [Micromonospora phaseoli]SEJ94910.1 hypothetical protein SAMN05443287_11162 [Micromonospora phaseoli]
MGATDPGSAREEAERLVATLLATVRLAAADPSATPFGPIGGIVTGVLGHSGAPDVSPGSTGSGFATGAGECRVCPVCRGIAALRDPSPEFAERLATGAGDLAAGLASFLRAFAPAEPPAEPPADPPSDPAGPAAAGPDSDHVWREATRTGHDSQPAPERDVWSAATRAEDDAVPADAPVDAAGPVAPTARRSSTDRRVVPASRLPDGEPASVGGEPTPDGPAVPGERQGAPGDGA